MKVINFNFSDMLVYNYYIIVW